ALYVFDDTFRGRFLVSPDALYLVRGATDGSGVTFFRIPRTVIAGAIDWGSVMESRLVDLPYGLVIADAIWVEDPSHQTEPVQGRAFVFTGNWPTQDKYLSDGRPPRWPRHGRRSGRIPCLAPLRRGAGHARR